jgi:hypothetical protein
MYETQHGAKGLAPRFDPGDWDIAGLFAEAGIA